MSIKEKKDPSFSCGPYFVDKLRASSERHVDYAENHDDQGGSPCRPTEAT